MTLVIASGGPAPELCATFHHYSVPMKQLLLAFDTSAQSGKVRHTLMGSDYGYTHTMPSQQKDVLVSLPVNVVAHAQKSPAQALDDMTAICQALGVTLEKCVTFEVTESLALPA